MSSRLLLRLHTRKHRPDDDAVLRDAHGRRAAYAG